MRIFLNASEIAGLINKNKYTSQIEVIQDILCRIKKEKNTVDLDKLSIITKDELIELLESFQESKLINNELNKEYKNKLKTCKKDDLPELSKNILDNVAVQSVKIKCTEESKNIQANIEKNIKKVMKTKDTNKVNEYITGHINKNRGIENENKIIKKYEEKNKTIVNDNNSCLYKMKLFNVKDHSIYICGKIDGIENNTLIEIKNRRNRLFSFIPLYEQIQIEIYFRLTNLDNGKLIQNYNDTQSIFEIKKNDELWNTILQEINEACHIIVDSL